MNSTRKQKFVLVILGLCVGFLFSEGVLRLIPTSESVIDDSILGRIGNSKLDRWDDNGFHNKKALESVEIVAIGDSQTEGDNTSDPNDAWPQIVGSLFYPRELDGHPIPAGYRFIAEYISEVLKYYEQN